MQRMSVAPPTEGPANPYPDAAGTVTDVTYNNGLMLLRLKDAEVIRNGSKADFIVGADYSIDFRFNDEGPRNVTVPRGMLTDLVSVPPVFRSWVGRVGPYLEGAIVHDYLYIAWQDADGGSPRKADRKFADQVFLEAMRAANVWRFTSWIIYTAVRLFGGFAYRRREEMRYVDLSDSEIVAQLPRPIGEALVETCQSKPKPTV